MSGIAIKIILSVAAVIGLYVLSYSPVFAYVAFRKKVESFEERKKAVLKVADFYAPVAWLQFNVPIFQTIYKPYADFWIRVFDADS